MKCEYVIGGKKYIQKPLVLGQIMQLMELLKGVVIPKHIDTFGLISALGQHLGPALAIVLIPEGVALKDKDIKMLESEIVFEVTPEQVVEIIEHFFTLNPIASLLQKLSGMVESVSKKITKTGLSNSPASLQAETSPKETTLSGDTLQKSASPSSPTGNEKSSSEKQ